MCSLNPQSTHLVPLYCLHPLKRCITFQNGIHRKYISITNYKIPRKCSIWGLTVGPGRSLLRAKVTWYIIWCSKLLMIFWISFPQQMFLLWLQKKTSPGKERPPCHWSSTDGLGCSDTEVVTTMSCSFHNYTTVRLCDFCFRNNMWYAVLNCTLSHLCVCLRIKFFSVFVNKKVFVSSYRFVVSFWHFQLVTLLTLFNNNNLTFGE